FLSKNSTLHWRSVPGYSGTPLAAKLGIKPSFEIHLIRPPEDYVSLVSPLPGGVKFAERMSKRTDLVHLFTSCKTELAKSLHSCREKLKPDAAVWVSWPKRASKVPTDITEDTVRECACRWVSWISKYAPSR